MKHPIPYIYYVRKVLSKEVVSRPYHSVGAAKGQATRHNRRGWYGPVEVVAHAVLDIGEVVK